jgi:hypothetical protein
MEFITGDDKDDSNLANDVIRHEMNHHSIFPSSAPSGGRDVISISGILTASFQNSGTEKINNQEPYKWRKP